MATGSRRAVFLRMNNSPRGTRNSEHRPRSSRKRRGAVGVIVRESRLLIIRRSRLVPAPLAFCFPGGGIEAGESEEQALVREIQEELGVSVAPVERLWSSVTSWGVDLAWWLADLPGEIEPIPSPAEVESVHWCSLDEMEQLPQLLESNRHFLAAVRSGEIRLAL